MWFSLSKGRQYIVGCFKTSRVTEIYCTTLSTVSLAKLEHLLWKVGGNWCRGFWWWKLMWLPELLWLQHSFLSLSIHVLLLRKTSCLIHWRHKWTSETKIHHKETVFPFHALTWSYPQVKLTWLNETITSPFSIGTIFPSTHSMKHIFPGINFSMFVWSPSTLETPKTDGWIFVPPSFRWAGGQQFPEKNAKIFETFQHLEYL